MPAERPAHLKPPANLTPSPPVPEPRAAPPPDPAKDPLDPTRYGDWELNGIAVDF